MKRKLNILQLVNVRWFNACAWYALNLSLGLRKRGHKVIIGGRGESPVLRRGEELGFPVANLPLGELSPLKTATHLLHLGSLIKRESIDLVNAHRGEGHIYASLLRGLHNVPVVRTRGDRRPPFANPFNLLLHRYLTDGVIVTCSSLKSPLLKLGLREDKIEVISPGVDTEYFQPGIKPTEAKRALGWNSSTPLVGMVGRLSPVKGHKFFIEAASLVVKKVPKAKFLIIGEDAQIRSSELKELAQSKGVLDRFIFLAYQGDIRAIISALDLGVMASTGSETICRVALEFMAMEKPVVGAEINSIPELVADGSNGIIVPPADPEKLAQAILEILQNRDKRREFGREARRRAVEEFSLDRLAESTERLYNELL